MSRHGPPGRRSGPRHGSRLNVDIATDTARVPARSVRPAPEHAVATVYRVLGTRGRLRLVMLVRCPFCEAWHVHSAVADFIVGTRTASCHSGRYVVHVGALELGGAA